MACQHCHLLKCEIVNVVLLSVIAGRVKFRWNFFTSGYAFKKSRTRGLHLEACLQIVLSVSLHERRVVTSKTLHIQVFLQVRQFFLQLICLSSAYLQLTFAAFTVANLDVSISRSCPQVGNLEFRLKHNRLKNSPTWVCPAASHKSVCCSIKSGSDDVLWCFMASTVQCAICVTVCIICV